MMKRYAATLILLLLVFSPLTAFAKPPTPDLNKDVFYQIIVRSFYDSNGDGIGDLKGLTLKLDYLQDLGVTAIWITPIVASHMYHNYFADDFYKIDPSLGTTEDFRNLCMQLHKRGMKILLDMETQYITKDHEWYKTAIADPKSEYNDYIAWIDREEELTLSGISNYTEVSSYNGITEGIMTVNMESPKVLEYNKKLFGYWLDPNNDGNFSDGVDGYRMDHIGDDLDNKKIFTGLLSKFWKPVVDYTRKIKPDVVYLAEPADWASPWDDLLTDSDMDAAFNIPLRSNFVAMDSVSTAAGIDTIKAGRKDKYSFNFIENHDINRFASEVSSNPGHLRIGAVLNLTLPGVPCLYYGQELGTRGEKLEGLTDGNDIPMREAFRWYKDWTKKGMAVWYKVPKITKSSYLTDEFWANAYVKNDDGTTLEEQKGNASSLWNYYKKIIAIRKANSALQSGDTIVTDTKDKELLAFVRTGEKPVAVITNFSKTNKKQMIDLSKCGIKAGEHTDLISGKKVAVDDPSKITVDMEGYQTIILK